MLLPPIYRVIYLKTCIPFCSKLHYSKKKCEWTRFDPFIYPLTTKEMFYFYYFYSYLQNTLVVISHYLARWIYYSIAAIPSYNITIIPRTFNVLTDICMFYAQSRMSLRMLNGSMSASVTNLSTCLRYSTLPLNAH